MLSLFNKSFFIIKCANYSPQPVFDVSQDSFVTTTELSSTVDEDLHSPSHCAFDHCPPFDLPSSSPQSISPPHPSDPQADLKPDSIAHDGYLLQPSSSDHTIEYPAPIDQELAHFPDRSEKVFGVESISVGDVHTLLLTHSGEVYGCGRNDQGGQVLST
ncbi:hypothetical protein P9112_006431 [Eukaryota sp. TZLM1-RC]